MKSQFFENMFQSNNNLGKLDIHKVKEVNVTYVENQQEILDQESFQINNQNIKQLQNKNNLQNNSHLQNQNKSIKNQHITNQKWQTLQNKHYKDVKWQSQFKHQDVYVKNLNLVESIEISKNKEEKQNISKNQSLQKSKQKRQNLPIKINYQELYSNLKLSQSNQFSELASPKQSQFDLIYKKQSKQSTPQSLKQPQHVKSQSIQHKNLSNIQSQSDKILNNIQSRQDRKQINQNQIMYYQKEHPQNNNQQNEFVSQPHSNEQILHEQTLQENKFNFQTFKKLHPILKQLQTQLKNLKFPTKPSFSLQNVPHNQKIRSSSFILNSKDNLGVNKLFYRRQRPIKIYSSSKNAKSDQKRPYHILKTIKSYLQLIATGSLDNLSSIQIQQINKQKMLKVGLFYERVCMIVVAYGYLKLIDQKGYLKINDIQQFSMVNQLSKFMINMISFALNNNLVLQKIIEKHLINQIQQAPLNNLQSFQVQNAKFGQDDPNKVKVSKSDRIIMKRNFDALRSNNEFISQTFSKITFQDESFSQNFKNICKCISKFSIQQTFYNLLDYFSFYLSITGNQHQIPFLAVAPNPYLPPLETHDKKYTLVIDFIQVFCHGTKKSKNHIFRPYSQHFLAQMNRYYNIVSFSSALPNQIDGIIDILDHKKLIKHRLYKHHMIEQENSIYVKDLSRIGRSLENLILLDVVQNDISKSNTFCIELWKGSKNDSILAQLCPILASIAIQNIQCRQALNLIKQQRQKNLKNGIHYLNFGINFNSLSMMNQN